MTRCFFFVLWPACMCSQLTLNSISKICHHLPNVGILTSYSARNLSLYTSTLKAMRDTKVMSILHKILITPQQDWAFAVLHRSFHHHRSQAEVLPDFTLEAMLLSSKHVIQVKLQISSHTLEKLASRVMTKYITYYCNKISHGYRKCQCLEVKSYKNANSCFVAK